MQHQWIIVADAAHARIFATVPPATRLRELHDLSHPESQRYARQLRTGGKGEVMDSAGSGQHQADPQTSQSEKHAERFAKEICEFLQQKRDAGAFDSLVLVAEPKVLGRLRDNLDQRTAQLVADSIDKNWAKHDASQIEKLLANRQ
ncbi:MAG TPA: host attachment protein [Salinisphaeraceae bacterium]|nr:host attachment protein [Salinisphaeraceae bacterium]